DRDDDRHRHGEQAEDQGDRAASEELVHAVAKAVSPGGLHRGADCIPTLSGVTSSAPGLLGFRIAATSMRGLDWPRLEAIWAAAGELDVFSAGWMSDHVADAGQERGGVAFESLTTAAALAHRVPGKWIGIAVLSNTFRHPALVAKAATVLDNVT